MLADPGRGSQAVPLSLKQQHTLKNPFAVFLHHQRSSIWKGRGRSGKGDVERSLQVCGTGQAGHLPSCSRGSRMQSPSVPCGAADKGKSHWCWSNACSGGVVAPQHWWGAMGLAGDSCRSRALCRSPCVGREQLEELIFAKIERSLPTHLHPAQHSPVAPRIHQLVVSWLAAGPVFPS